MTVRTLADAIDIIDAAFTVGMLAHEVDCWQIELPFARITRLLVIEVDSSLLHLCDLLLAVSDLGNFLVLPSVVLVDALLLSFEVF